MKSGDTTGWQQDFFHFLGGWGLWRNFGALSAPHTFSVPSCLGQWWLKGHHQELSGPGPLASHPFSILLSFRGCGGGVSLSISFFQWPPRGKKGWCCLFSPEFAYDCSQLVDTFVSLKNWTFSCLLYHSPSLWAMITVMASFALETTGKQSFLMCGNMNVKMDFSPGYWDIIDITLFSQLYNIIIG